MQLEGAPVVTVSCMGAPYLIHESCTGNSVMGLLTSTTEFPTFLVPAWFVSLYEIPDPAGAGSGLHFAQSV